MGKQQREAGSSPQSEKVAEAPADANWWERYREHRRIKKEKILARRREKGFIRDWIETIVSVVLIVFVIRVTLVEAYRIPTGSMENTLLVGDFLLVNKFVYGIRTPDWLGIPFTNVGFTVPYTRLPGFRKVKQGDILVFRYPLDTRINYIKRCIATGGQTVEIRDKIVYVDGVKQDLPPHGKYADSTVLPKNLLMPQIRPYGMGNRDNYGPVTVPEGHFFMMGDNRDNSADSRYWGFLSEDLVLGKALIIYFSWDKHAPLYKFWEKIRWLRITQLIR